MRLIDADKFLKEILTAGIGKTIIEYSESDIGYMIRRQPTVDAAEVLRNQWISVKDRLPDEEGKYIVIAYNGITIDILYFYKRYPYCNKGIRTDRPVWCGYDDYGDFEVKSVTHWVPLPEPPDKPC